MFTCSFVVCNPHSVEQDFVEIQRFEDINLQGMHLFLGQMFGLFSQLPGTVTVAEVLVQVKLSLETAPVPQCSRVVRLPHALCFRFCQIRLARWSLANLWFYFFWRILRYVGCTARAIFCLNRNLQQVFSSRFVHDRFCHFSHC